MIATLIVLAILLAFSFLAAFGLAGANPGNNSNLFIDGLMIFLIIVLLLPIFAILVILWIGRKVPYLKKIAEPVDEHFRKFLNKLFGVK